MPRLTLRDNASFETVPTRGTKRTRSMFMVDKMAAVNVV